MEEENETELVLIRTSILNVFLTRKNGGGRAFFLGKWVRCCPTKKGVLKAVFIFVHLLNLWMG